MKTKTQRGFTFIEILVVTTVIAILTTIAAVSYTSVSKRSRDSKRVGDVEQIRSALELCRSEVGSYPVSVAAGVVCGSNTYLSPLPVDPKNGQVGGGGLTYGYVYNRPTTTTYSVCFLMEDNTNCSGTIVSGKCCRYNP